LLADNAIRISMDGRGSWRDNVFVERLWRSVNEAVYLRAYECVAEARSSIGEYFGCYDRKRPHSSLDGRTPDHVYSAGLAVAGRLGISPPLRGIA
jgi:putative transposase